MSERKDPTYNERRKRYRRRHPDRWAASARRYNHRTGTIPGDFGGHKHGRRPWEEWEEAAVLDHEVSDRRLADELGRSVKAVQIRRYQIKKRLASQAKPVAPTPETQSPNPRTEP